MRIYFICHAAAEDDIRDSYGGIANDPLIESGCEYARKVGKSLVNKGIEVIYTSPYLRAKETADIINKTINVEVVEIFNLRERNSYGVLSGVEKQRAKFLFPEIVKRIVFMNENGFKPSSTTESLPGAEIYLDLLLRARDAFKQIFREGYLKGFQTIAVVTHGGFAWAFFRDVLNIAKKLEARGIFVLEGNDLDSISVKEIESDANAYNSPKSKISNSPPNTQKS
jgi:broad specificity phosphatase PhoE